MKLLSEQQSAATKPALPLPPTADGKNARRTQQVGGSSESYVLQVGGGGLDRLEVSEETYGFATETFVEKLRTQTPRAWPQSPLRMAIMACGPGSQLESLTKLVLPTTQIYCSDISEQQIALAQRMADKLGRHDIHFNILDIESTSSEQLFDVVQARFMLVHLQKPKTALKNMWSMVGPGGTLLCEEHSISGIGSSPSHSDVELAKKWMTELGQHRGVDFTLGDRLAELFNEADIPLTAFQAQRIGYSKGRPKMLFEMSLREGRSNYINANIAHSAKFEQVCDAIKRFADRSDTTMFVGHLAQAAACRASACAEE
jgi:SAM-dependent methyltransferase